MNDLDYLRSCRKTVFTHEYLQASLNLWHIMGNDHRPPCDYHDMELVIYGDFRIMRLTRSKKRQPLFHHNYFAHIEFFPFIYTWLTKGKARSFFAPDLREARNGGFVFNSVDDGGIQLALIKYASSWRLISEWGEVCNTSINLQQFRGLMRSYVWAVQRKTFQQWGVDMAPVVLGGYGRNTVSRPARLELLRFEDPASTPQPHLPRAAR